MTIKIRTLVRIVYVLCAIGLVLAVIGIADAYDKVGVGSREGHILTIAIGVAAVSLTIALTIHRRLFNQRGPVIVCMDKSGSMHGQIRDWAQTMLMSLKDEAHRQRRNLWILYFDHAAPDADFYPKGAGELHEFPPCIGGTRFDLVIDRALDLCIGRRPNIVFITDGMADAKPEWLERVAARKKEKGASIDAVVLFDPRWPDFKLPFADTIEQTNIHKPLPATSLLVNQRLR